MNRLFDLATTFASEGQSQFTFRSRKVKAKIRHLTVPNEGMRALHVALQERLREIPDLNVLTHSSYGAFRGRSVVENAGRHAHNRFFFQLDLANAYPSTRIDLLADVLEYLDPNLGARDEIHAFLLTYCAGKNGGLGVGAPASPFLFDLYCCVAIDAVIKKIAPRLTYTRYLDDLTFSSKTPIPTILRKRIRDAIHKAGFAVNHRKSHRTDREKSSVTITGVVITRNGTLRPTEEFLVRMKRLLPEVRRNYTHEDWSELQGLAGHLFQFADCSEWPGWSISQDVHHLQKKTRSVLGPSVVAYTESKSSSSRLHFSQRFLYEIQSRISVRDVAARYIKHGWIKKRGRDYFARCPYHTEKTPSFSMVPPKGFYHCFGCGSHGDVFQLVIDFEKVSFPEAVRKLATECGLSEHKP